jgi:hypothetical protein
MKTMTALLVGLTTALALSTAAVAEPWKDRTPLSFDRSPDATASIQSNPNTPSIAVNTPTTEGFNQRGPDWTATSPVGSQTRHGTVASSS